MKRSDSSELRRVRPDVTLASAHSFFIPSTLAARETEALLDGATVSSVSAAAPVAQAKSSSSQAPAECCRTAAFRGSRTVRCRLNKHC